VVTTQEEIEQKSFNIMISTTKLSARTVLRAVKAAFRLYQSKASQGKQSVRTLLRQNRGVSSVEISKTGIRGLERYAKKYGIDYAQGHLRGAAPVSGLFQSPGRRSLQLGVQRVFGIPAEQGQTPLGTGTVAGTGAGSGRTPRQSPAQGTGAWAVTTKKLTKLLALYLPYLLLGLVATNLGEAWRLAEGKELGDKIMSMMGTIPVAFADPLPSLHPLDLLVGLCCGAGLWLAVYLKGKNAKKYRHGMEYGSARWGTPKDIEPFMAPKFEDNIILTKTERLMMSNRPPDPKNARNKNVLVVGGSGSGKTRFWLKPNLLQCHSSYVVTDPKGTIVLECGNAMLKNGYKVKILNTINFSKSMHYNPFAYVHSEKDILKLVTTLMTNTKGEGSGGDPFWEKSERLLLTALIAYLHYEAPVEEQNFATLLEMLNTMQVLEDDEEYQNPVDLLFEELAKKKPNSFAGRQYKLYKLAAGDICSK